MPKSNHWVELGEALPWNDIEQLYNHRLSNGKRDAGNKPAHMIIGVLLIKHKMNLSDHETILAIQENPYMQYCTHPRKIQAGFCKKKDRGNINSDIFPDGWRNIY